jgi:hypothetical protein
VFETEELNAQISTLHVENLRLCLGDRSWLTTQEEREKPKCILTDAELQCVSHPFRPVPLSFIFTPNFVLVSHSIIGYPFPNDGHESATLTLGACAYSQSQPPSPRHYPDHWVSKLFLHFRHGSRDAVYITNSPQLRYCSRFSIYFDGVSHLASLHNHADFVALRFSA